MRRYRARHARRACEALRAEAQRENKLYMFYTYVLKSLEDEKFYIGFTDDLKKRFFEHKNGQVVSTRNRRPLKLVYYEACNDKYKALGREKYFKTGFGRRFLKDRI